MVCKRAEKRKLSQELGDYLSDSDTYSRGSEAGSSEPVLERLRQVFLTVQSSVLLEGSLASPLLGEGVRGSFSATYWRKLEWRAFFARINFAASWPSCGQSHPAPLPSGELQVRGQRGCMHGWREVAGVSPACPTPGSSTGAFSSAQSTSGHLSWKTSLSVVLVV